MRCAPPFAAAQCAVRAAIRYRQVRGAHHHSLPPSARCAPPFATAKRTVRTTERYRPVRGARCHSLPPSFAAAKVAGRRKFPTRQSSRMTGGILFVRIRYELGRKRVDSNAFSANTSPANLQTIFQQTFELPKACCFSCS